MNSKRRLLTKCALAIAMVPFHTYATTRQVGLEACADALVNELTLSNGSAVSYQLDPANEGFGGRMTSVELYSLYAKDSQSSELVSKMDCVVNSRGRVIRLTNMPLEASETGKQVSKND